MIFSLISVFFFIGYVLLITAITFGWWRLKVFNSSGLLPEIKVSVIVAARNEAGNIRMLLKSLLAQNYPSHLLEIIIVDDHSNDSTSQLVEEIMARKKEIRNLKLITLEVSDDSGKKAAINRGIQSSTCELIVITDADCTSGTLWISTIAAYYSVHKPQMILGPVFMMDSGSFFGRLQSLEFTSLISSAAGSCSGGFPILANGANVAFTRFAYESCGGFTGNMQYPSGDDMFLLSSIKSKFGAEAIRFLRSEQAIVNTPATLGFKPFIQQRLRWVSKSRGYTDLVLILSSVIVFLTNVWLVVMAFASIISQEYLFLFLAIFILKMIFDLPLMISYSRFQRSISLLWLFPLMELLNAIYTLLIGIAGNIGKYEWKGRHISHQKMEH
jgi:cellulose synthase/poly-beta-1,6-N-acetylglucosamine synthase-like glycosyltransferase